MSYGNKTRLFHVVRFLDTKKEYLLPFITEPDQEVFRLTEDGDFATTSLVSYMLNEAIDEGRAISVGFATLSLSVISNEEVE
ncbi:hypothetical protein MOO17_12400 [Escherichia coli]|uniref:hypothetical protein n=1 Tax=Escherichia coli TaxID=562 RepID=UPI001FF3E75C|nr:hypothetical protein [Escherichia coli]MCJ8478823.1 hypothetical protein [Escherichia coli]